MTHVRNELHFLMIEIKERKETPNYFLEKSEGLLFFVKIDCLTDSLVITMFAIYKRINKAFCLHLIALTRSKAFYWSCYAT